MTEIKEFVEIVQGVITIIAIIVGGIWSYLLFVRNRLKFPRANITCSVVSNKIIDDKILLHVNIIVSNTGLVLIALNELETRVQKVIPLPTDIVEKIEKGLDPVRSGQTEIEYPLLGSRRINPQKGAYEIEPGESQEIQCDFVIGAEVKTVAIYTYMKNQNKSGKEIGWDTTIFYDLDGRQENDRRSE